MIEDRVIDEKIKEIIAMEEQPYIKKIVVELAYNPKFGDDRVCQCGHTYYRHFDTYDDMYPCGCKYCECVEFVEKK